MKFFRYNFTQVRNAEEFSSFLIRLPLGTVACLICGLGMYLDIIHITLQNYLIIAVFFYFFTLIFFIDLFRTPASSIRRYATLFTDITFPSITIYFTTADTQIFWLLYLWLYIGYGHRYGRPYIRAALIITLIEYNMALYFSNAWSTNNLFDLVAHMIVLVLLPIYLLSMLKRLHAAKDQALNLAKLKSQFLASMSHEIRTPLNGIIGTSLLLSQSKLNTHQQKLTKALKCSSEILLNLINDILDFSKIEANKVNLEQKPISIKKTITSIIQTLLFSAEQKKLELKYEIDNHIPEFVMGDQKRLNQILLNLAGNAIKFTPQGSIKISVKLEQKSSTQCRLLFKVSDTGIGISAKDQEIIFDRFTQVGENIYNASSGTGLGTTICKELVEIMGGNINLQSEPDKGSEFSFQLAFEISSNTSLETKLVAKKSIEEKKSLSILIAEDDDINAMVLEQFLIQQGHKSQRVTNGLKALQTLPSKHFDLILMDLHMPEVSGIDATKQIRSSTNKNIKSIIIIGLTANATTEHQQICIQAGMNDFLAKPITPDTLEKALSKYC